MVKNEWSKMSIFGDIFVFVLDPFLYYLLDYQVDVILLSLYYNKKCYNII